MAHIAVTNGLVSVYLPKLAGRGLGGIGRDEEMKRLGWWKGRGGRTCFPRHRGEGDAVEVHS